MAASLSRPQCVNSLAHGRFDSNIGLTIFKPLSKIYIFCISFGIALRWTPYIAIWRHQTPISETSRQRNAPYHMMCRWCVSYSLDCAHFIWFSLCVPLVHFLSSCLFFILYFCFVCCIVYIGSGYSRGSSKTRGSSLHVLVYPGSLGREQSSGTWISNYTLQC